MSLSRTLAVTGAAALSLIGSASAQAATQNLAYDCQYPLIGNQALSVAINATIPTKLASGQETGAFAIKAVATAGGDTGSAIALIGAKSLEGSAIADAVIAGPGYSLPVGVPITVAKYSVPAGNKPNLVLSATGTTPSITPPAAGYSTVDVNNLNLVLTAKKADGTAITQLSKAQTIAASDADPATFDVACKLKAGQNPRLANIAVADASGAVPGTNPGTPSVNRVVAMPSTGTVVPYDYDLTGSASLRTLVKGSLPLKGSAAATLNLGTGAFSANLQFARTAGTLNALGFLPVVARVDVVPEAPATGTLANGVLTATAKVRIKLPSVTLGGIQLGGGGGCQAKHASTISLRSKDKVFLPLDGGELTGAFAISELVNCGFLNGLISPLTSGSGNAISIKLVSKL